MKTKILLVEDDIFLREGLSEMLTKEGYDITLAENFAKANEKIKEHFDLAILDIMLPDGNGLELCQKIRESGKNLPILFLTACDDEIQIVRGLDAGADDYVTKPFRLLELLSRIRALLRRSGNQILSDKNITVDNDNMTVTKDGKTISLTPTEYMILKTLMSNRGVIVTRNILLEKIWDCDESFIDDNTLSVHVSRLREKIGSEYIATVRGVGYRWEESK
ncbi:MAG: response regulator transcription factor [Clostridia bacterium]|nr:response regulator transcription factor [Clostridia bacterium]